MRISSNVRVMCTSIFARSNVDIIIAGFRVAKATIAVSDLKGGRGAGGSNEEVEGYRDKFAGCHGFEM